VGPEGVAADMWGFVLRRLAVSVPLLLAASVLVFALVANSSDPLADLYDLPDVTPEVIDARRAALGLDRPVVERYRSWLTEFVQGDFGKTQAGREVRGLLWERLQVTLRMTIGATVLALIVALLVGILAAVRQHSAFDKVTRVVGYLFLSVPLFWVGGLLKEYAAIRLNRLLGGQFVFTVGQATPNLSGTLAHRLADYAGHLVLPTITLALGPIAGWSRHLRASALDALSADHVVAARAKGLPEWRVVTGHVLRNSLIPFSTVVALRFGHILGGAVVVERVFSWQGMGQMLTDGVTRADTNVVLAWLMVTATTVLIFNLLADLAYGWLDPRIRAD
jgi:peptide/nickel transport system permease protein